MLLNLGGLAGIAAYGFLNWDYGEEEFNFRNEHWFNRDSKEGGMDKLGHFWSNYAFAHLLSNVYHRWGYTESEANTYGALSSFGLQGAMEIMDGFSGYGVSYEDFLMNTAGAAIGYLWGRCPVLKSMIDFRMEYIPSFDEDTTISPGVQIAGDVAIGSDVLVGVGAVISNLVTVGARARIGAGAVVVRHVGPDETVVCRDLTATGVQR